MRRLVTGTDDQGRSCVISEAEIELVEPLPGNLVSMEQLFATAELPPPWRSVGTSEKLDLGVGAGLSWMVVRWEPNGEWPPHFTDTLDLDLVLNGTIDLVLGDGAHRLEAGDCVVVEGVDHAWRAGPDGCTMIITAIGTPRT